MISNYSSGEIFLKVAKYVGKRLLDLYAECSWLKWQTSGSFVCALSFISKSVCSINSISWLPLLSRFSSVNLSSLESTDKIKQVHCTYKNLENHFVFASFRGVLGLHIRTHIRIHIFLYISLLGNVKQKLNVKPVYHLDKSYDRRYRHVINLHRGSRVILIQSGDVELNPGPKS